LKESKSKARKAALEAKHKKRRIIFKRAEEYVKEYRRQERDLVRLKREARKHNNFYVPDEPKLAFVIRIRGYV
jgi:hypothetical protein